MSFTVVVVAGLLLLAWERWGSGRRAGFPIVTEPVPRDDPRPEEREQRHNNC